MITRAEKGTRGWRKPMQNGGAGIRESRISRASTSIERMSQSRVLHSMSLLVDLGIERRGYSHCHESQLVVLRFVSEVQPSTLHMHKYLHLRVNDMSPPCADGPTQARYSDREDLQIT
jgi:hypothetical protein